MKLSFSLLMCSDNVVPTKLYVGNLPETVRKADLQQMFEGFGKVLECDIVLNYAFVVGFLIVVIFWSKNCSSCKSYCSVNNFRIYVTS